MAVSFMKRLGILNLSIMLTGILTLIFIVYNFLLLSAVASANTELAAVIDDSVKIGQLNARIHKLSADLPTGFGEREFTVDRVKQEFGMAVDKITKSLNMTYENFTAYDGTTTQKYKEKKFSVTLKNITREQLTKFIFQVSNDLKLLTSQVVNVSFEKEGDRIRTANVIFVFFEWKELQ